MNADPFVLLVAGAAELWTERGPHEPLMVVRSRVDQMSELFFGTPFADAA